MSKRKTPDKGCLNGPKPKRQKLSHDRNNNNNNNNNNNTNKEQTIGSSTIFNDTNTLETAINVHCYDMDNNNLSSTSIIEIKKHNISLNGKSLLIDNNDNNKNKNGLSINECHRLCAKMGQRVKIYWTEDKQWYYGTIKDFKTSTNESLIVYDDGENEWLNLTKSGNETVEFLYDPIEINKNETIENDQELGINTNIKIGNKISSGKVVSTFNNGCIANINLKLDNKTNSNFTAIAFDNKYIEHLINNQLINIHPFQSNNNSNNASMDIFKLLHFCQFDKSMKNNDITTNNLSNGGQRNQRRNRKSLRQRNRNSNNKEKEIEMKTENDGNDEFELSEYDDIAPWILIGCTSQNDPITKINDESHINLIHTNNDYKNCKHKTYINGYNGNSSNRMNKKNNRNYSNIHNSHIGKNNNNITKKCNNKSIVDLKAIYPLQTIRKQNYEKKRSIIIIGAGISGLSAARECMNYGYNVIVLEARDRAGGRILTDYSMGLDDNHGCDVGGGWIHGVERNPLTRLVERLKLTLHSTSGTIQMFDHKGIEVEEKLDTKVEKEFNGLLDRISKENEERFKRIHGDNMNTNSSNKRDLKSNDKNVSLGESLNTYLKSKKKRMSTEEYNLWHWHFSNLEYSNASDLSNLSLTDWDQDDEYAFNGDHCLIQEGYGRIIGGLKEGVNIKYNNIVTKIDWRNDKIMVYTKRNKHIDDMKEKEDETDNESTVSPSSGIGSEISSSTSNSSMITHDSSIMNNSINIGENTGYNKSLNIDESKKIIENLSHIDLCKVDDDDEEDQDDDIQHIEHVPIYAMLPKSTDSHSKTYQFVKLKDVRGRTHYEDNNDLQNGHNLKTENEEEEDEEDEDNDVFMSADIESDDDDDEEVMEYIADAVIVTLPLGILKKGDVEFLPKLPAWKCAAINSIGFGLLNKVFLKFENVFWEIDNDYVGYASSIHGEFYLFVNLVPVCGTPVLMSLISGSFAEKLEKKTDKEIVNYAMKILENIFENKSKKKKIPKPKDYYITRWGKDRFCKGSYSFIAKGSNGDHYDKLSYSVKDKLYFAGEATIRKWPASVHGAYLSGIREARKIMNNHYIHNEEHKVLPTTAKNTRRKRKKNNNLNNNKLTSQILKAGLTEFPTDTIFKPIKDQPIRMSMRRNLENKYSSSNQSSKYKISKKKKKKLKIVKKQKRNKSSNNSSRSRLRRYHNNNDQDISSMSDSSSVTSSTDEDEEEEEDQEYDDNDKELTCTLCGGIGYLSDDNDLNDLNASSNSKKSMNEKLIGPFILNNNSKCYIHFGCGQWSPDIHNQDNVWYNVISCIRRSKYIRCCYCGEYGASVHCHNTMCLSSYHPECAHTSQCWDFDRPDEGHLFFCIKHRLNILSLFIKEHETKLLSINKNQKNQLRSPKPPTIRR